MNNEKLMTDAYDMGVECARLWVHEIRNNQDLVVSLDGGDWDAFVELVGTDEGDLFDDAMEQWEDGASSVCVPHNEQNQKNRAEEAIALLKEDGGEFALEWVELLKTYPDIVHSYNLWGFSTPQGFGVYSKVQADELLDDWTEQRVIHVLFEGAL